MLQMRFSDKQLQPFKTSLLERKKALLKANETAVKAEQVVELDQARVGRLSRMDALQAQAMSVETGRLRRLTLVKIDAALKRIANSAFGECIECCEPINPQRLTADPTATLCIKCAEKLE